MVTVFEIHPADPQPRLVARVVDLLREGALIGYPTDSGYAFGCAMGYQVGTERIRRIRQLGPNHHFTLVCANFSQLGQLVHLGNSAFRAIKAATPGPYTFILPASAEVPRRLAHLKKKTVGVRIPNNRVARAIVTELGEPLLSSSMLIPPSEEATDGRTHAPGDAWTVVDLLGSALDAVVDGGAVPDEPTTVVNWAAGFPMVRRVGAGDPTRFE